MIPLQRLLLYFGVLCLLPLFFAGFTLQMEWKEQLRASRELELIEQRIVSAHHRGMRNAKVRERFAGADSMYLSERLEPLALLAREQRALLELVENEPSLPNKEVLQRYDFLNSGKNQLSFAEGVVQTMGSLRETLESLTHPVEVDEADLAELLALVEGEGERPQFLITDFRIERKRVASENEVYLLDLKVLKREYTEK